MIVWYIFLVLTICLCLLFFTGSNDNAKYLIFIYVSFPSVMYCIRMKKSL